MKLLIKIDSLFDSRIKRLNWLQICVLLYWGWQFLWLSLMMADLFQVQESDSLFLFLDRMKRYDPSVFVRIAFRILNYRSVFSSLNLVDWIFLSLSVFLVFVYHTKTVWILAGIGSIVIAFISGCLLYGLNIANMRALFHLLKIMAVIALVLSVVFIIIDLYLVIERLLKMGESVDISEKCS